MMNQPISRFVKYIVPDDGACGYHAMAIHMICLVRSGSYTFPKTYSAFLSRYLDDSALEIAYSKIQNQKNRNELNFSKLLSKESILKIARSLKTSLDINNVITSLVSIDELYSLMYIMSSVWIQYLKHEDHFETASEQCGDLAMWCLAKHLDVTLEGYETLWQTPVHRTYRDSIYTKITLCFFFDIAHGHIEPILPSCAHHDELTSKLFSKGELQINNAECRSHETFWWGYASRAADYIKPLLFTSPAASNREGSISDKGAGMHMTLYKRS